jgi:hypothetical protein
MQSKQAASPDPCMQGWLPAHPSSAASRVGYPPRAGPIDGLTDRLLSDSRSKHCNNLTLKNDSATAALTSSSHHVSCMLHHQYRIHYLLKIIMMRQPQSCPTLCGPLQPRCLSTTAHRLAAKSSSAATRWRLQPPSIAIALRRLCCKHLRQESNKHIFCLQVGYATGLAHHQGCACA